MSDDITFYRLERVTIPSPAPDEFQLESAAIMSCDLCGCTISGSGGPGDGVICIPCGDVVKSGQAKACINWEDP